MSRYSASRYDGDRRSRSPRDRSPQYADRADRGSQYGEGDRRRQSVDTRTNTTAFQSNARELFRDSVTGREPPRGPKALLDPPSGPRGGSFAADFRGRGRGGTGGGGGGGGGGGRGRGWRDDSRDRGRDRDPDFRDRPHFRDERSRERDREWRDRDRDLFPRGRRASPQGGRGRSPIGRDFRDARDAPLGVDAERARRGSRDGPLSAGSSSSDPPFAPSSFRGGFPRGGRGRGRGDWERGGRGRGNFYDDRDRYGPRSRSQEGRWGREQEERDRRDARYMDPAREVREERDVRERERPDLIRPKPDRVSHEPPASTKDISPPPLAPSAPSFGSVPARVPSTADIQSLTGKAPPTGPRALTEERPVSAGLAVTNETRQPPTGPSKPTLPDGSPPIPVGPRAQQKQQQRSSKQWINPALAGKKIPESPKIARSQSFASQQHPRPFGNYRPDSSHSDHHGDFERRPRSSDAQSDPQHGTTDVQLRGLHITGANDTPIKSERGTQSARASIDRDTRTVIENEDVKMADVAKSGGEEMAQPHEDSASPTVSKFGKAPDVEPRGGTEQPKHAAGVERKRTVISVPSARVQLPVKQPVVPATDELSESDDDDDIDDYFESEISKAEAELQKLEAAADGVPIRIVARYASVIHEAMLKVVTDGTGLVDMIGGLPEGFTFPCPKPGDQVVEKPLPVVEAERQPTAPPVRESSAIPTVENGDDSMNHPPDPQPKLEEMDTEGSGLPPLPVHQQVPSQDEDVHMEDAPEAQEAHPLGPIPQPAPSNGIPADVNGVAPPAPPFDQPISGRTSPSAIDEDSEDRTEDDVSIYGSIEVVRQYSATPPTDELPIFTSRPWYESKKVRKLSEDSDGFSSYLLNQIREVTTTTLGEQEAMRQEFARNYDKYLRFTLSDDPAAVKSRDSFSTSTVPSAGGNGKPSVAPDSKPEGGRRAGGRFSTELDVEYAIQQSIRELQEKQEREARAQKEKYRSEKEATIPDMYWTPEEKEQGLFYDVAGLLPLEKLVATWQVVPWHVNFTEEEAERFEKAYLESPKQWGKIARDMPRRDFGTCIQYYYAKKRELNLKDKLKKQPRRRKKGRGKQRSSALVSELGNTENETEEQQDNGENGERRRPRRAAAPTWGYEATPNADSDGTTPAATPGRRRGAATAESRNDSGAEKPEAKKPGRRARQPKADKEPKVPKPAQALAPTPPAAAPGKVNRSRSNSRAQQGPEWLSPQTPADLGPRPPPPFEGPPGGMQPPMAPVQQPALASPERVAPPMPSTISEVMAPPSLRPEPPPPPTSVPTFDIGQPTSERGRGQGQASSYWSVSETTDFPSLLRSFGTDWGSIAAYMQTKTAVMVKNYFSRQKDNGKVEWEALAAEADSKRQRGEKRPAPPTPTTGPRKRYDMQSTGHRPLAAAESEDMPLTKTEPPPSSQGYRIQFNIAQSSPSPHPLAQPSPVLMTAPVPSSVAPPPQHPSNSSSSSNCNNSNCNNNSSSSSSSSISFSSNSNSNSNSSSSRRRCSNNNNQHRCHHHHRRRHRPSNSNCTKLQAGQPSPKRCHLVIALSGRRPPHLSIRRENMNPSRRRNRHCSPRRSMCASHRNLLPISPQLLARRVLRVRRAQPDGHRI
ncbi:hypothetical protein B0T19DRAFT_260434 [Cercophora scortea]|uniref:SANT domain-containing protein n=1 Tax=Cercophora scortea TaxID=314031 RepID=A0AAE0IAN2_9PEZI|nr:hypothetical protein B0T19DRAFT_260434 [Cercophora scortea]